MHSGSKSTAAIAEPLRPGRILEKSKRFAPLRTFSCGRSGLPWEKMVNEWARDLYRGTTPGADTVVVLEDRERKLIGFASFRAHELPIRGGKLLGNSQRIHVLGTDRAYHGLHLVDGSRPGDALLRAALDQIETTCDGRMPVVSALIAQENDRSRALFARHGFRELPYAGVGDVIHVRRPQKLLPSLARQSGAPVRSRVARWIAPKARKPEDSERRARRATP